MNLYEELQEEACQNRIDICDYTFSSDRIKGLYCDGTIALSKSLETQAEKACVLAEELGHHYTSTGDILDQSDPAARKQEFHARLWGYNKMVGLHGIVSAYKHHCRNLAEMADYLDVTEPFLTECLEAYRRKYGCCVELDNYVIMFEPRLAVYEKF